MSSKKLVAFLLLSASILVGVVKSECPNEEDIAPCSCGVENGQSVLKCLNITDVLDLERVAQNSDGYRYDGVIIEACSLQYIPKVVTETIRMSNLTLRNLTLIHLFNDIPNSLEELTLIVMDDVKTLTRFSWEYFNNTPSLVELFVYRLDQPVITEEFNKYVTKNLWYIKMEGLQTKEIAEGAFKDFGKLFALSLNNNKLESLRPEFFPDPSNLQLLYVEYNRLTSIPAGFFDGMYKLANIWLRGNFISRINQDAFGAFKGFAILDDNPLKCDCYILWIYDREIIRYDGECVAPKRFEGKHLNTLSKKDFDC